MSEAQGYQWIVDPSGHQWRVIGLSEVVAHLVDGEGREMNVGKSILQSGMANGEWKIAEFEEVSL